MFVHVHAVVHTYIFNQIFNKKIFNYPYRILSHLVSMCVIICCICNHHHTTHLTGVLNVRSTDLLNFVHKGREDFSCYIYIYVHYEVIAINK